MILEYEKKNEVPGHVQTCDVLYLTFQRLGDREIAPYLLMLQTKSFILRMSNFRIANRGYFFVASSISKIVPRGAGAKGSTRSTRSIAVQLNETQFQPFLHHGS